MLMASTATNVVPVCPDDGVALFAQTGKTAYAGFGNRLGWMLVLSAVAGSLNRTVFCPWTSKIAQFSDPGVPPAYDLNELKRIVAFPQKLHVVADGKWSGGVHKPTFRSRTALASRIYQLKESTLHALQEAQYYVPEVFWEVWAGPLGDPALLACQVPSRSGFLSAYTQMRSQFKPMVDLHNREPRSFMVLHVRRRLTDFLGVRVPIQIMNSTISLVSAIFQATSIPWLVLGQSEAVAQDARAQLTAMHVAVVNRPTLSGVSLEYRLIRGVLPATCPIALRCPTCSTYTRARRSTSRWHPHTLAVTTLRVFGHRFFCHLHCCRSTGGCTMGN